MEVGCAGWGSSGSHQRGVAFRVGVWLELFFVFFSLWGYEWGWHLLIFQKKKNKKKNASMSEATLLLDIVYASDLGREQVQQDR